MKNDTTFVRMRSGDHLEDAKCRKGHLAPSNLTFLLIAIDLQNHASGFYFLPGDLVLIFQSLVMILPRFLHFERP